ncbi:11255_t:CDS:2 [Dentiscutata heterogama]|uniref:11255_t:CDS:1 n=1 Tax=Dentiscutata heterogama TaxID=1316150 RepID=A0ACA9MDC4_9GLOM|nr:11255_t:CDS:2 [Dentiscutata heterogama]
MESLDDSVFSAVLKLKNFCIDDDVKEEIENEVCEMQPQKRTKAQREALRKRRESAAIFNRLDEDTSVNFLSDNIDDFSRTLSDDGVDDNQTATEQLHIIEKAKNSLDHFKETVSKFNAPLQSQMNASCSTPIDQGLGTPNVFSSNYHSNSSMTSRGEYKKTRASSLRPPTSLSRLKPPIQKRLNSAETTFHAMNNSSEDNKSASNLPNSRILRPTSVRPKK